jgi:phosphoenolpyruvate synthase
MGSSAWIAGFKDVDKTSLSMAGGKGANLGELTQMDVPVPPGFVITTRAYTHFVETNDLQDNIIELASQTSADDPISYETTSAKIQAYFARGNIPDDLATTIRAAYAQLDESSEIAVAVRSSATAEDLPTASFAGQQDTYLNVQGADAVLDAVQKCWASLWTARAIAYRARQGIDPTSVSLAVVVQRLVPADAAGVLFTANPLTGQRDQILINATWGLGEAIVSGQVTPDTVIVDKTDWQVVSSEIATKTVMTVRTDTGTHEQPVPAEQQKRPVLDDPTAVQLARYGVQIATHYGIPMDIEWAVAGGAIAILQARPITSLPPAPLENVTWEPTVPKTIWMRRQIVEHMPEPLSPLFEDLYLDRGLSESMEVLLGAMSEMANTRL